VSAFFILTANSGMQHPVGYRIVGHRAELMDFWAVLGNSTLWAEFSHTVLGVSGWRSTMMKPVPGRSPTAGWRLTNCGRAHRRVARCAREYFNDQA
jgi:hypothetical protein